jgi:VWFA-related protein
MRVRFLLVMLMGVVALASTPEITAQQQSRSQQEPDFRAVVDRVRIDVIVTDEDGNFVTDLRPEEFVLYEDNAPQPVMGFQLVDLTEGEVTNLAAGGFELEGVGAYRPGEPAATVPTTDPSALGAMVFLIDGPSIDTNVRARFSQAWATVLDQTNEFKIPRAVYFINNVGEVEEIAPLTFDVETLREAAITVAALPTYGVQWTQRFRDMIEDMENPRAPGTRGSDLRGGNFAAEERARSVATLELVTRFCDALSARPGRTAMVWVSTGIMLTEGGPASALLAAEDEAMGGELGTREARSDQWGYFSPDARLLDLQNDLHEIANSANVSIYSIDPTSLGQLRGAGFDASVGGNVAVSGGAPREGGGRSVPDADLLGSPQVQTALEGMRDSLRNAAEATGGRAMVHWTDLESALEEIRADTSRFYLLTYAPPTDYRDGEYHEVRVEVLRPGLTVRERGGYVAMPEMLKEERVIAAALALPGTVTELQVEAEAYKKWTTQGQAIVQIAVNIEGEVTDGMIESGSGLELHLVVLDSNREVIRQTSRGIHATPELTAYGAVTATIPFTYFDEKWWNLEPGGYDIRLVVRDGLSRQLGATRVVFEMPDSTIGWRTSDLMLGIVGESRNPKPVVARKVVEGQRVAAFLEVNGGLSPTISGSLYQVGEQRSEDEEPDLEHVSEIRPSLMRRHPDRVQRGAIMLPEDMPPGEYIFEVRIEDPPADQERTFRVPLEILASSPGPGTRR